MSPKTAEVLKNLREAAESEIVDKNGVKWLGVYLDNARKGMPTNEFRAQLALLSKLGLYRVVDGYAWGDVRETDLGA